MQEYGLFLTLLRAARVEAGLTQQEVASRLRATQTFVSKCERGERRLDIVELRAWCVAIDTTLGEFAVRFDSARK
jgi:transcriptional regulator with XRE-family HTH domain